MQKRLILLVLATAVALVLAACGGGEEAAPESAATVLNYSGYDEFRYDPTEASVEAGTEVTINFKNEGALDHNWLLISSRVNPEEATEADAVAGATTGEVLGGESASVTFTAPPAGDYKVVCTVPGHATGGMVADFTITP